MTKSTGDQPLQLTLEILNYKISLTYLVPLLKILLGLKQGKNNPGMELTAPSMTILQALSG